MSDLTIGRVRCVSCGGVFKGHIPKGGDGSRLLPYRHKRWVKSSEIVPAQRVPCDGHLIVGRDVIE